MTPPTTQPDAAAPEDPEPRPGLRERQKARTRAAIRAAALELMSEHGYEATTVAQIAEAADISHTTFFRYFQSKEQVIVSDDLQSAWDTAIAQTPAGLGRFDLMRRLISELFHIGSQDPWASNAQRHRLLHDEPLLQMAHQVDTERRFSQLTDFVSEYFGISATDLRLRVFIGAMTGALAPLIDDADGHHDVLLSDLLIAVDLLQQGLPL